MGAIADKRLGDFLPTIDAYRPVAMAVAAILALVVVVPGAVSDDGGSTADLSTTPASDADELASAPVGDDAEPAAQPAAAPSSRPAPAAVPVRPSPAAAPAVGRTPVPSGGGGTPARTPAVAPAPDLGPSDPAADDEQPLRIAAAGWASSTGGTPVAPATADSIPEGTLPVGTRIGQTDKVAFVRLTGDATVLVLAEDADGRRGSAFEAPPVQLCQITDGGWEAGEDQAMADAPAHDPDVCVAGQQRPDGTWAFTLSLFESPTDDRGLALVPAPDAPLDFQLTFAGQALT